MFFLITINISKSVNTSPLVGDIWLCLVRYLLQQLFSILVPRAALLGYLLLKDLKVFLTYNYGK